MKLRGRIFMLVFMFSILPALGLGLFCFLKFNDISVFLISLGISGLILVTAHLLYRKFRYTLNSVFEGATDSNSASHEGRTFDATELKKVAQQIDSILDNINCPFALCEMIYDENGKSIDFRYIRVNPAFNQILGCEDPTGKKVSEAFPTFEQKWIDKYGEIVKSGESESFKGYFEQSNKWWQVYVYTIDANQFGAVFYDITDLVDDQKQLEDEVDQLHESVVLGNEELQKTNQILTEKMSELKKYQEKLRYLASRLTLTEEHERHRIASAMHDHIIQPLILLDFKVNSLSIDKGKTEAGEKIADIKGIISDLIKLTREFTFELSYPILYELGIEAAIEEWLKDEIEDKHGIETVFVDDYSKKPLDDDIRSFLFESVRELLVNITKHSDAQNVEVDISREGDIIVIKVKDNGRGFGVKQTLSKVGKDSGFGLFSIRERLSYFEGSFEIRSKPGKGTSVILKVPLNLSVAEER